MTTTVLNTKIDEVENKIPNDSKYVTIHKFNKFIGKTFDTKLKQAKLVASSSNTVLDLANKNKLKTEKLQTFDSNYFFLVKFILVVMVLKICLSVNI